MQTGSWARGAQIAVAAAIAVEAVNHNEALLPGRELVLFRWADSGCSAKQGLAEMGRLLEGKNRIYAVIGPGCRCAVCHFCVPYCADCFFVSAAAEHVR